VGNRSRFSGRALTATRRLDPDEVRKPSPARHAALALLLLVATMLGVYKPRGMTSYGQRKQHERRTASKP
jgi:hypothetical protein